MGGSVKDMLLMYGAVRLLIKDSQLELKANRRDGILGHSGAGETTLMKEVDRGRVVGMPMLLKGTYVDTSKFGRGSSTRWSAPVRRLRSLTPRLGP